MESNASPPREARQLEESQRSEVGEELADVVCYALSLANALELDLAATVERKMVKNRRKYPAEEYRGRFGDNDPGKSSSNRES